MDGVRKAAGADERVKRELNELVMVKTIIR